MRAHRSLSRPRLLAMIFATVVLGHELTYLLAHGLSGYHVAMAEAGHERYWLTFVVIVGSVGVALTMAATRQLLRLRRLASGMGKPGNDEPGLFRKLLGDLWLRTALGGAAIYFVQENLESATAGQSVPGLEVFAGEHLMALPLILAAGLAIALMGALVLWRREILLGRLRSALPTRRQAPRFARYSSLSTVPSLQVSAANCVRAPPRMTLQPA